MIMNIVIIIKPPYVSYLMYSRQVVKQTTKSLFIKTNPTTQNDQYTPNPMH